MILEATGRTAKTHSGTHAEAARLMAGDQRFDPSQRAFLGRAYNYKAIADYAVGREVSVTREQVVAVQAVATTFLATIQGVLEAEMTGPGSRT